METVRLHQEVHRRVRQLGYLIRAPYHLIFHRSNAIDDLWMSHMYNREFMLCNCGYCFDGYYDSLDCAKCHPDDAERIKEAFNK